MIKNKVQKFFSTTGPITALDYIKLLVGVLFWGTAYVMVRSIALDMEPMALAFCRVAATAIFFFPLAIMERTPIKQVWSAKWYLLAMGFTGAALFMSLMSYGLYHSSATNGSLINATYPLAAVLVSALVLKVKIQKHAILPLCCAILGSLILILAKPNSGSTGFALGDLAFVVNVFVWCTFSLLFVPFNNRLPAVTWAFWVNFIGSVLLIPLVIWEGFDFSTISITTILKLAYVGIFCGGFATITWGQCVNRLGMATAGLFNNINPLFSVILASIFLGESLNGGQLIGGAILMTAVAFYSFKDYYSHTKTKNTATLKIKKSA